MTALPAADARVRLPSSRATIVLATVAVVAVLYVGREFFVTS